MLNVKTLEATPYLKGLDKKEESCKLEPLISTQYKMAAQ